MWQAVYGGEFEADLAPVLDNPDHARYVTMPELDPVPYGRGLEVDEKIAQRVSEMPWAFETQRENVRLDDEGRPRLVDYGLVVGRQSPQV